MSSKPIALITGGSRGIGFALIKAFHDQGYHIVTTTTQASGIQKVHAHIPSADVIVWDALKDNIDAITQHFIQHQYHPDVLICNAGITRDQLAIRLTPQHWQDVYQVNTTSAALLSTWALRGMYTKKSGTILFLSSVVAHTGNVGQANYIVSKSALEGLTRALAVEGAARNIRVNCIAPGMIESDMTQSLTEAQKSAALSRIPLGKMGTADDIAQCAVYLAHAPYITGQIIHVNGGMFFGA
jgi:3-oxoacyl-[acyl-carrier protein] reductase